MPDLERPIAMEQSRAVRISAERSSNPPDSTVAQPSLQPGEHQRQQQQYRTKRDCWPFITQNVRLALAPELHQHLFSSERLASPYASSHCLYGERPPSRGKGDVEIRQPSVSSDGLSTSRRLSRGNSRRRSNLPTIMEKRYSQVAGAMQSSSVSPRVKRWDSRTRTTSHWDGLRRDSELFSQSGNCLVHFHEKGQSRRGPSLKVPIEYIYTSRFASLFSVCHTEFGPECLEDNAQHRGLQSQCDLYIPACEELIRKDAFTWHITTRNFFAFILGRPVVGASLGHALIDLRARLDVFRPDDYHNSIDMMSYLERIGYLDIAHCPDYALAILNFAEHFRMRELWTDAFVHCVGMNQQLNRSPEYQYVSQITQALITRAYLEMDLHLGRVMKSMSNFLEQDFSSSQFGASPGARIHLDRFRTFLHSHYVEKFGYWPPPRTAQFSKTLYKSMYFDFRALHDYIVDVDSTDSLTDQRPASGGICVLQNVKAFDSRHKFIPLPNPHPLIPRGIPSPRVPAQRSLRSFKIGARTDPHLESAASQEALRTATNSSDRAVMSIGLVKAYQRFEKECTERVEEKVSLADARKVRWLLIYGTLQMLISILRAPKEVRFTETVYPLCCLVTGNPPWEAGTKALKSQHTESVILLPSHEATDAVAELSVHPDCEGENFFAPSSLASSNSSTILAVEELSPSARVVSAPISSPAPSIRSLSQGKPLRNSSFRSIQTIQNISNSLGSIARRSGRRASMPSPSISYVDLVSKPATKNNFCEIMVKGYGNGLNDTPKDQAELIPSELSTEVLPEMVVATRPKSIPLMIRAVHAKPDLENLFANSQKIELPADDQCNRLFSEPARTPLMDTFSSESSLPGLEESSGTPSSYSSLDADVTALARAGSSSRSASPQSSSSITSTGASTPTSEHLFGVSMPAIVPTISRSDSTHTPAAYSPPLHSPASVVSKDPLDLPMVVAIEELRVYQPTGAPSICKSFSSNYSNGSSASPVTDSPLDDASDDEFPTRPGDKVNVANKTGVFKTSLMKTRNLAQESVMRRRSARIGVEPAAIEGSKRWSRIGFGQSVASY